eukprot:Gb_37327 [translate_table: standard]
MAKLFRLLQVLGERIDCNIGTQTDGEEVEARFRSILSNLLQGYIQLSKANEREFTAILKLLSHTVKQFPGVFYHGQGSAILPILGWIIPFFAEPAVGDRHSVLYETMATLLSLLRTGDHESYRQFILDAMLVIEDLLSVASFYATKSNFTISTALSITCFSESFSGVYSSSSPAPFCHLPACWKQPDSPGILIDVTGEPRWQSFAHWILKQLGKCLAEATFQVEGLISPLFMSTSCTLLCYGEGALQMACFDFVRIATSVMDADTIPSEKLILSILSILSSEGENPVPFSMHTFTEGVLLDLIWPFDIVTGKS